MYIRKLYQVIASTIEARQNCKKTGNEEWFQKHNETLEKISKQYLPSGSGIDFGSSVLVESSTAQKIIIQLSYHHLNDAGMYDGYTQHEIIVTPSLSNEFDIRITGRNKNGIKEYLADLFNQVLTSEEYSIDSWYDHFCDKLYSFGSNPYKVEFKWIDSSRYEITCNNKQFKTPHEAKLYAIGKMNNQE